MLRSTGAADELILQILEDVLADVTASGFNRYVEVCQKIPEILYPVTIYPLLYGDDDGSQRTRQALPQRTVRP